MIALFYASALFDNSIPSVGVLYAGMASDYRSKLIPSYELYKGKKMPGLFVPGFFPYRLLTWYSSS